MEQTEKEENFKLPVKRVKGENLKDKLTKNAYERILPARYLIKDVNGETKENPEEMFRRVAKNVAKPDKEYDYDYDESVEEFYELMTNLEFMPNSPTLMNAGAELQQLSACFVIQPEDDLDSIFDSVHNAAKIFQSGGGVGYPFHLIRPKGDRVKSTGGIASGPLSFMKVYDKMCETIKQGGKRRGAQMGVMKVDHPDILRFIVAKREEGTLSNFNISVGVTEDFMKAVKNNEEFTLINPRTNEPHKVTKQTAEFYNKDEEWYPKEEGSDIGREKNFWRDFADEIEGISQFNISLEPGEEMTLPARFIWKVMVDCAWSNGEPGLFMYDRANKLHSFDVDKYPEHKIQSTNPCGEQPLENFGVCNLGHINLSLLVKDKSDESGVRFQKWMKDTKYDTESDEELRKAIREYLNKTLRMNKFEYVVKTATRFLDNVITMSEFPLEKIEEKAASTRKIGLGLMGFAQMLIQLGIQYGSKESIVVAEEIQRLITKFSVEKSKELSKKRGKFPEWEKSKWANPSKNQEWFKKYSGGKDPENYENGFEMRNHNTTTIAPTGTTSMIANTSGGCEPIFSLAYFKNVGKDIQGEDMLVEFDDYFLRTLKKNGADLDRVKNKAIELMKNNKWEGVDSLPEEILPSNAKKIFKTSKEVTPEEHVKIQAAFQKYNHSSISKTCNFPNEASRKDVEEAFMLAYDSGVKGLTVYRDGSRDVQVMTTRGKSPEEFEKEELLKMLKEKYGSFENFLESNEFKENLDSDKFIIRSKARDKEIRKARERPKTVSGTTQKIDTGYGSLFVTINQDKEGLFEVFSTVGKSGGFTQSFTDALGRLISTALRAGVDPEEIIDQLKGIRSPKTSWDNGEKILSIPDAVGKAMARYLSGEASDVQTSVQDFSEDKSKFSLNNSANDSRSASSDFDNFEDMVKNGKNPECPECGAMVEYKEGCVTCPSCGWSECG